MIEKEETQYKKSTLDEAALRDLERMASDGEYPDSFTGLSDRLYYMSMMNLYELYRKGVYDRNRAKQIKSDLLKEYRQNAFGEDLLRHHTYIRNRYSHILTEAEKSGCLICKKLVRVFDGRDQE